MIEQYLPQTNESATVPKTFQFWQLNNALASSPCQIFCPAPVPAPALTLIGAESWNGPLVYWLMIDDGGTEEGSWFMRTIAIFDLSSCDTVIWSSITVA